MFILRKNLRNNFSLIMIFILLSGCISSLEVSQNKVRKKLSKECDCEVQLYPDPGVELYKDSAQGFDVSLNFSKSKRDLCQESNEQFNILAKQYMKITFEELFKHKEFRKGYNRIGIEFFTSIHPNERREIVDCSQRKIFYFDSIPLN